MIRQTQKRELIRALLVGSTLGEAYALYKLGCNHDFVSAYLIVAAWTKDFLHRFVDWAIRSDGPSRRLREQHKEIAEVPGGRE